MNQDIITQLTSVLRQRQEADPASSYVASLYAKGTNKILEKVGEEATEVIIAAKDMQSDASHSNGKALAGEVADLWFHTMVMLVHQGIDPNLVLDVLSDRFGLSGHEEKANRDKSGLS